jgi:hypothetical protein
MTFAEKFCAQRKIPPEAFEPTVLRLALRSVARLLAPLLNLNRDYFTADREFIRCVGRISRRQEFEAEALDFALDSNGRDFWHRTLKLRVSRRRLRHLVREVLREQRG